MVIQSVQFCGPRTNLVFNLTSDHKNFCLKSRIFCFTNNPIFLYKMFQHIIIFLNNYFVSNSWVILEGASVPTICICLCSLIYNYICSDF